MAAATAKTKPRRDALPEILPEATDFGTSRDELHPLRVIQLVKSHPQCWAPLRRAAENAASQLGSKRISGSWALAYLAFVFSDQVDVEPWWSKANSSIWREAGFRERPSYQSTHRRFAELEQHIDAFEEAARILIGRAVKGSGGKVGRHLVVDSTAAQTNARLHHDCPDTSPCHKARGRRITPNAGAERIRADRHAGSAGPEPQDLSAPVLGDADEVICDERGKRIRVGSCWYRLLDETAGARAYTDGRGKARKFWTGFYNGKAVDVHTGAVTAVHVTAADVQECNAYPDLYAKAVHATGVTPVAVAGDRGFSVSSVFEHNTRLGVASVFPWRASGSRKHRSMEDCSDHDRHGIARCRHCGAPCRMVRFERSSNSGPRLHVACELPVTAGCRTVQTIACKRNWRMLLPLQRTSEAYLALNNISKELERVHGHWRQRYRVAGEDPVTRPKRRGIACQQLRASAAVLVEWLIICAREGWLSSLRLRRKGRSGPSYRREAKTALARLLARRSQIGLDRPYGPAAGRLGVGPAAPPGR